MHTRGGDYDLAIEKKIEERMDAGSNHFNN